MRKKILAFVFAAGLLSALALPVFSGGGTAEAFPGRVPASVPDNDTGAGAAGGATDTANGVLNVLEAFTPPAGAPPLP